MNICGAWGTGKMVRKKEYRGKALGERKGRRGNPFSPVPLPWGKTDCRVAQMEKYCIRRLGPGPFRRYLPAVGSALVRGFIGARVEMACL